MDEIIKKAIEYLENIFNGNSDGHGADHSLRVYNNASLIRKAYECNELYVDLGALLHDVDDHKLFKNKNNENARKFLVENDFDSKAIEDIVEIINSVSFTKNKGTKPKTLEACIVQDADRLDAIGAIGIARTFMYSGKHERGIEDLLKHFDEKLLLLKDMMNTDEAKRLAQKRDSFMKEFLSEINDELGYKNKYL